VRGSDSIEFQTTVDDIARFHAFWKHDHEIEKIHFTDDIPVGATVETGRVEMWSVLNGVQ